MMRPETVLIIGPSGCGKTYLLLNNILSDEKKNKYDYIIIICSTLWVNDTYMSWNALWKDKDVISLQINDINKLDDIISMIIKIYSGSKVCIVIDDISHDSLQHKTFNQLSYLGYSGRHHNFSLYILSQKLNSISTGIRDNCTRLIFFKTHNRNSIEVMKKEFFGHLSNDESDKVIEKWKKGKYLDINLNEGKYNVW